MTTMQDDSGGSYVGGLGRTSGLIYIYFVIHFQRRASCLPQKTLKNTDNDCEAGSMPVSEK